MIMLSGCEARERWILGSPSFYPTALDYWVGERVFLVGSYHDGAIQRMAHDGSHTYEAYLERHSDGRRRALRLKVDEARNRLWVLDADAMYVYALYERKLLQRIALPQALISRAACVPDMTLDRSTGRAYVSDNREPVIYRIEADPSGASYRQTTLTVHTGSRTALSVGFSALQLLEEPRTLLAGIASAGELWRIDPETGTAARIAAPHLKGICGMTTLSRNDPPLYHPLRSPLVYVSTGFGNEVIKLTLSPDLNGSAASRIAPLMPVDTPISLVAFNPFLIVTSSQLGRHQDFEGTQQVTLPFRLVLLPSALETFMGVHK